MSFIYDQNRPLLRRHHTQTGHFITSNESSEDAKYEYKSATRVKSEEALHLLTENKIGNSKAVNDIPLGINKVNTKNSTPENHKVTSIDRDSIIELNHAVLPTQLLDITNDTKENTKLAAPLRSTNLLSDLASDNIMPWSNHVTDDSLSQNQKYLHNEIGIERPESPKEHIENSEEEKELLSTSNRTSSHGDFFRPSINNVSHADMTLNTSFVQQPDKETENEVLLDIKNEDNILKELNGLRWQGLDDGDYSSTIELNSTSLEQTMPPFEMYNPHGGVAGKYHKDSFPKRDHLCSAPMHMIEKCNPESTALPYVFELPDKNVGPACLSNKSQGRKRTLEELCSKTNIAKAPKKVGLSKKVKVKKLHDYLSPE